MIDLKEIGVLFDLDGVLVDSHDQHHGAWIRLADEIGVPQLTDAQFAESFGMRNEMCIPQVFHWAKPEETEKIQQLGDRKEEFYREILAAETIEPLPGVKTFVQMLSENGIPGSVGSSTSILNIELCMNATGLDQFFGPNITGAEDVDHGKPAPDVFLAAAKKINRLPENCLVIEDAHVGVEAGQAGGMKVLAVTTTHPAASFEKYAPSKIVDRLDEVSLERLIQMFA